MIKICSTKDVTRKGVNILVYGASGSGKTFAVRTIAGTMLLIDIEAGTMALSGTDIPMVHVKSVDDLKEVFSYIMGNPGMYDTIVIDSITELGEIILADEKSKTKDGRQAYMKMGEIIDGILKTLRDMEGINVICIAKQERVQDDDGKLVYSPSLPGSKATQNLPYIFDEVFALRTDRDQNGKIVRHFQTVGDEKYLAKDRSGKLDFAEEPNYEAILKKIRGEV